jgi:hypothetical protein
LLHRLDSLTETTKDLDHAVRDLNGRLERLPGHQTKNGDVTAIAKP